MSIPSDQLADAMAAVLQNAENELRLEQAVYGLDSMEELQLHRVLADGLSGQFEVAREVHYPSSAGHKRTHRQRCDLVLSPKGRPIKRDFEPTTLFDPPNQIDPRDGTWIEIKCAYQFKSFGQRHSGYGQQWRASIVADLKKIQSETAIDRGFLLMIVFTESSQIVEKDLNLFEAVLIEKDVLAGFRQVRGFDVQDRIGHTRCTVAIWPTVEGDAVNDRSET